MEIELVVIARLELQLYTQQRVMDGIADFKMTIGIPGMSTENLLTDGVFIGNLANGTMIARFLQAADNLCLIQRIGCDDMRSEEHTLNSVTRESRMPSSA